MKKIILIGGAPTVGKSFLARKLAKQLKLPWISTDTVREQMRKIVRRTDYPNLFYFCGLTPKYIREHTAKEIVRDQNKESMDVWKGVQALIDTDYCWDSFIVEGVAVLPALVPKGVKAVFLVEDDINLIRKTIYTRGLWADADKYSDSYKEKEVEWVIAFNQYIRAEAKKYGLPVVKARDLKAVLKALE